MNTHNPDGSMTPSRATADPEFETAPPSAGDRPEGADPADGELSSIGLLCDGIASAVNAVPGCPDDVKLAIAVQTANILSLFAETKHEVWSARKRIAGLKSDLRRTREQLAVLRQEHFGASSENALAGDDEEDLVSALEDEDDGKDVGETRKGKRARKQPKDIPTTVVDHYPDNRTCCTCGCEMPSISSWSSHRLRIVPEHVECVKDVYHTCACNHGICKENKPVSAKAQNHILKGCSIELASIVEAASQKYFEHTATYRMARRLGYTNVNRSRQAIGRGMARVAEHLRPVREALFAHVKAGHAAHMDETPLRVLAPGKGKCATGYIWAICRDETRWNPDAQPAVYYHYAPSRAGSVAAELLDGAALRFLLTDGYGGDNGLFKSEGQNDAMISVRCWAHVRRKFCEAWVGTRSPLANRIVKMIRKLYAVEKAAAGLAPADREALRLARSLPVLDEIHAELLKYRDDAEGKVKTAITYTLKAFDSLRHFVFDGRLEIDNNPVERCMRGIVQTRRNSLFAGSQAAAEVWAIYYTLIESARLNHINPRAFLNWVTQEIERTKGEIDHSQLLPWHCPVGRIDD